MVWIFVTLPEENLTWIPMDLIGSHPKSPSPSHIPARLSQTGSFDNSAAKIKGTKERYNQTLS
jgi:hypothetical protein